MKWHEMVKEVLSRSLEMESQHPERQVLDLTSYAGCPPTWIRKTRYGYREMLTTSKDLFLTHLLTYQLATLSQQNLTLTPTDGSAPSYVTVWTTRTEGLQLRAEAQLALIPFTPVCISLLLSSSGHGQKILDRVWVISVRPFLRGFLGVFIDLDNRE